MFKKMMGLLLACLLLGTAGIAYAAGSETERPGISSVQPGEPTPEHTYYTVTFETGDGSAVEAQTVEEGSAAIRPADPVREGYAFDGWFADANYERTFDFNAPVTANLTIYAKWTKTAEPDPDGVTVSFDANGGTPVAPQMVQRGKTAVPPVNPTREGFTFLNWMLNGEVFDFNTPVETDITLVALWEKNEVATYTVTFETAGGSTVDKVTVEEGATVKKPVDPMRDGYSFDGWFADAGLTVPFDFSAPVGSDLTVYARWKEASSQPVASVDTRLSYLSIECGELYPAFSPNIYAYTVYVTPEQENRSCRILCDTVSKEATVKTDGAQTVGHTDVVRKVRVSGGGRYSDYTIIVHVMTFREFLLDGELYSMTDRPNPKNLPGTYTVGQMTMFGEKVTAAQSTDGQLILVQYLAQSEEKEPVWYRYEPTIRKLYPVSVVTRNKVDYLMVDEGHQLLYGSDAGVGTYYVYDKETGELVFQSQNISELTVTPAPIVIDQSFHTWPLTIFLGLWAIGASVAVYLFYRRRKLEKANTMYFRPYFSAEGDGAKRDTEKTPKADAKTNPEEKRS